MYVMIFSLNEHKRFIHEKKWNHMCDVCGKGFRTHPELKHHIQLHHGDGTINISLGDHKYKKKQRLLKYWMLYSVVHTM